MTNSSTDGGDADLNSMAETGTDTDETIEHNDQIERKVQLPGGSTFAISLPKAWALEQELEAGMSMYLYAHRDRLVVAPAPIDGDERAIRIDVSAIDPETTSRRIEAAYAAGCDRITIDHLDRVDDDLRQSVTQVIRQLVGIEITDETEQEVVAQNVLDAGKVSLPQSVAQIRQLALEMHDESIEAVRTNDEGLAQRVISRDDNVDRLFAFVSRGFHRGLEDVHEVDRLDVDRTAAFLSYRKARELERIADHAEGIASIAMRQPTAPEETFADRLDSVGTDARDVVSLALSGDIDQAIATRASVRETITTLDRKLYETDEPNAYLYGSVLEHVRRTADCGVNVTDALIEATASGSGTRS